MLGETTQTQDWVKHMKTKSVSFDEWLVEDCPRHKGRYDFYNVMAVERVEGVVFQVAVGRVVMEAWERLAVDNMVEVLLG